TDRSASKNRYIITFSDIANFSRHETGRENVRAKQTIFIRYCFRQVYKNCISEWNMSTLSLQSIKRPAQFGSAEKWRSCLRTVRISSIARAVFLRKTKYTLTTGDRRANNHSISGLEILHLRAAFLN